MSRLSRWTISAKAYLAAANDYDYCADESVVPAAHRLSSSSTMLSSSSFTATLIGKKEEEEVIFPGFAMYQMAIAYHCQGQYSLALATTTDILSYQKKKLVSINNPQNNNDDGSINTTKSTAITTTVVVGTTTTTTSSNYTRGTPLDIRSAFMTHVEARIGTKFLSISPREKKEEQQNHHPILSNTIAVMITNYPTHHSVVKTLLLRGHILAACVEHQYDPSLILQAVCSIEMAVAIQRKIIVAVTTSCTTTTTATATNNDDQLLALVNALIILGSMKYQSRQNNNESLIVYREAFDILNDIRKRQQATKPDPHDSEKDFATTDQHDAMIHHHHQQQQAIMITHQIARLFYLQGKVYHCQSKFIEAFYYYNKSLSLLLKIKKKKKKSNSKTTAYCSSKSQDYTTNSGRISIKTITKCMKSKYAFEKLISAYWDDNCVI